MWGNTTMPYTPTIGGGSMTMPEKAGPSRSAELHEALSVVHKNAAEMREVSGRIRDRLLGPEPSMGATANHDEPKPIGGMLSDIVAMLREVAALQSATLSELYRVNGEI